MSDVREAIPNFGWGGFFYDIQNHPSDSANHPFYRDNFLGIFVIEYIKTISIN